MTTRLRRIRIRRAGAALLAFVMVGLAGCVGAGPAVSPPTTASPVGTRLISPSPMATQVPQPSVSPTPPAAWKSIEWASLVTPGWANGTSQFEVFGWSRGYVGFSIQPNSSTGNTSVGPNGSVDPIVVSYSSPDGVHWKEGQTLDTVAAGSPGWLQDIVSVIEGPGGLLAVGWGAFGCGPQYIMGLWTSSDGTSWQPVNTQTAFGQHGSHLAKVSGGSAGYVAVGFDGGDIWTSADGRAWQQVALDAPSFQNSKIDDGTAFSGGYVLGGTYGLLSCGDVHVATGPIPTLPPVTAAVWWSADAASWTRVALPGAASSSENQSMSVCRLSDHALLAVHDSWNNGATPPVTRQTTWISTDGRTWTSVTLPAEIHEEDILSDGLLALVVLPVASDANGFALLGHLSLQIFDANYALVTLQQSGDQPSLKLGSADGLVAVGPSGVVATDGHQLWMGTPSAG